MSDLARHAMHVFLNRLGRDELVGIQVNEFRTQMRSLDLKIDQLKADITSIKANDRQ